VNLFDELARRIAAQPPHPYLRIAVDGVDGAGKTMFAASLSQALRRFGHLVIESTVDNFHQPRALRYRQGRDSPDGFFEDSYDYPALLRCLLDPLSEGGDGRFRRAAFDHRRDEPVAAPLEAAPAGAILVLDGLFLHRRELREVWDFSVFLQVDFATSYARMARRDGCPADPDAPTNRRYRDGQLRYLRECRPAEHASAVVDNTDVEHPRLMSI
jgi:uridine kinase